MTDRPVAEIRIATPDDAPALAEMHVASWRETYLGLLPEKMLASLSVESRAAAWAKIMQEPATQRSTMVYIADYDGAIVGLGSCGSQRTESLKEKGLRRRSQRCLCAARVPETQGWNASPACGVFGSPEPRI
jgi:hypothetical protein